MKTTHVVTLTAVLICLSAVAFSQEFHALVSGSVADPSGAAVSGATISVTNVGTNASFSAKSGSDGSFLLSQLPPGPYELTVEAAGFQKYARSGITLSVGDKTSIQVSLRLGSSNESVTVNAELTGVEANQSVMGQLMSAKQIEDLPLNGRNVFILLELSAGVINTTQVWGSSGTTSSNAWGMSNGPYKIQGSFASTNAFMLDGAPILDNGSANYVPNADGVAEFKVNSFANDASLGLTGGGTINVTMKSGTNQYHGLLSEFFRNNIFDANFTQSNAAGLTSLQHQYNDYSAMLGGPIIKNKIFFFGLYEGFRDRPPFATTDTFPTVPQRVGDFSQTFNGSGQLITIYDPLSTQASGSNYVRTAFPGNGIPASRISPIALNMAIFAQRIEKVKLARSRG